MAIPTSQLETWSNQGATVTAEATHTSVRYALETANTSLVRGRNIQIFLQGSYRNVTNIYSDSDVDIVVQWSETFTYDLARLAEPARGMKQRELDNLGPAAYPWDNFRRDVVESLRRHYGAANVLEGNKALKLSPSSGRLAADVVPAIAHKLYRRSRYTGRDR